METCYKILLILCIDFDCLHFTRHLVLAEFRVPGLPRKKFLNLGDINLGALMPMSKFLVEEKQCSDTLNVQTDIHLPQVLEYAVSQVNRNGVLPRNITLGFVVLDDCYIVNHAVAQSLAFVPQTTCPTSEAPNYNESDIIVPYDVIGVIGSTRSSQSKAVAQLLSPAQVPLVSFFSTSDELSDKDLYPYFLRTVPPDRFQFSAIFTLIKEQGWTYVSVVYEEGSYGENGFKQLRDLFDASGVCLAVVHKVSILLTDNQSDLVARDLVEKKNARVVVLITVVDLAYKVIAATGRRQTRGNFIWVGSDGWAEEVTFMVGLGELLWGALVVGPPMGAVSDYDDHFEKLKPDDTTNPWFQDFWENFFNCSILNGTCSPNSTLANLSTYSYSGRVLDTVNVLANATARVLSSAACATLLGSSARGCITGPHLLAELMKTRQPGYTGWIELNVNGDRLGKYLLRQVMPAFTSEGIAEAGYLEVPVAEFDALSGRMTMLSNLSWVHQWVPRSQETPESRCSWPCAEGEARVPQEVKCCWLCQACRINERLADNGTRCEACPIFQWPDPTTGSTTCIDIPVDIQELNSIRGVAQSTLALGSFLCCLAVLVFFVRHRHKRVIKASSHELSLVMLLAICLGYVTILTLLATPTDITCRANYLLFCLSFAFLYGPLLMRALRIFRIFDAGKRTVRMPKLVGSGHQLLFSFGLILIQALMCAVVMAVYPTWHKLTMKVVTEPYVELSCDMHEVGLASFLVYNLLMVVVCAYLAFKTRRLPDNFNESRFISMCVSTTLVIWLASIPAYLVSGREHLKMLMLALALALNHSVALVFLFLPKVYAVLYLEGAQGGNITGFPSVDDRASIIGVNKPAGTLADNQMDEGKLRVCTLRSSNGPNWNQINPSS